MNAYRKISAAVLGAGLVALALPSFAEVIYEGPLLPTVRVSPARDYYYDPVRGEYYYYAPAPATTYYYTAPATTYYYTEPAIIVDAPRSVDQAITNDVVDKIASDPRISGNISVSTYNSKVELTGRVTNAGQAEIAGRDARSVDGVTDVQNNLQARVGGNR